MFLCCIWDISNSDWVTVWRNKSTPTIYKRIFKVQAPSLNLACLWSSDSRDDVLVKLWRHAKLWVRDLQSPPVLFSCSRLNLADHLWTWNWSYLKLDPPVIFIFLQVWSDQTLEQHPYGKKGEKNEEEISFCLFKLYCLFLCLIFLPPGQHKQLCFWNLPQNDDKTSPV